MNTVIRAATPNDASAIRELAHGERIDFDDLGYGCSVVAEDAGRLVGAAQIRTHDDGARELCCLVVAEDRGGSAVATRLIEFLQAGQSAPLHMITAAAHARHYAPFGFERVGARTAPKSLRHKFWMGQLGSVLSLLQGQSPRRLTILRRDTR